MEKPRIEGNVITIPSSDDYLPDVDSFLEGTLRGFGLEESLIADIAISVSELVNNAIFHGNKASPDKTVEVKVVLKKAEVVVSVKDQGTGFDPEKVDDPIAEENLLKEVGRGIFIIKSLMDTVDIVATESGTTTTITKTI